MYVQRLPVLVFVPDFVDVHFTLVNMSYQLYHF